MSKQKINCDVSTCKFQKESKCTLDEIKIGNCNTDATEKDETACKSFKCDDDCCPKK